VFLVGTTSQANDQVRRRPEVVSASLSVIYVLSLFQFPSLFLSWTQRHPETSVCRAIDRKLAAV
jgi:hypothetical protein